MRGAQRRGARVQRARQRARGSRRARRGLRERRGARAHDHLGQRLDALPACARVQRDAIAAGARSGTCSSSSGPSPAGSVSSAVRTRRDQLRIAVRRRQTAAHDRARADRVLPRDRRERERAPAEHDARCAAHRIRRTRRNAWAATRATARAARDCSALASDCAGTGFDTMHLDRDLDQTECARVRDQLALVRSRLPRHLRQPRQAAIAAQLEAGVARGVLDRLLDRGRVPRAEHGGPRLGCVVATSAARRRGRASAPGLPAGARACGQPPARAAAHAARARIQRRAGNRSRFARSKRRCAASRLSSARAPLYQAGKKAA